MPRGHRRYRAHAAENSCDIEVIRIAKEKPVEIDMLHLSHMHAW